MHSMKPLAKTLPMVMGCAVFAAGLVAAPSASAYPPGIQPTVITNKTQYKPKKKIKIRGADIQANCSVEFVVYGFNYKKTISGKAGSNGIAQGILNKGPKEPGRYKVNLHVLGKGGCAEESSRTRIRIKK